MLTPLLDKFWNDHAKLEAEAAANGWTERSQVRRLTAAMESVKPEPGSTVLDWGCGTGRLADFLPADSHYLGVDATDAMLERARLTRPDCHFVSTDDFVPSTVMFDYVFAIGPWNVKPWMPADTFHELYKLWALTGKALVASLLRTTGREESLTYDPIAVVEWASKIGGGAGWTVTTNHLPNDILVTVHR